MPIQLPVVDRCYFCDIIDRRDDRWNVLEETVVHRSTPARIRAAYFTSNFANISSIAASVGGCSTFPTAN